MPRYEIDSKITVLKKEYNVKDIVEVLSNNPANKTLEFFQTIGLSFPRELRINQLRDVLRMPVLLTREERASLADEMNYRLSWFNQFTETQLVNLFSFFKDTDLDKKYLEHLWLAMIEHMTDKKISEHDFERFIKESTEHSKKNGIKLQNVIDYNKTINPLFFDQKGKIDGLKPDVFRPVLYKSSTITEIRELGLKYDVNVPKRLRKNELIDIIVAELKERGEYTKETEDKLNSMNILLIQRFAINNKIKASTELKKEEVIEYILSNANETREAYFVPSSSVYEVEASDIGEAMPEVIEKPIVIEEEPVVEEPVEEEVKAEPVVEEEIKQEPIVKEVIIEKVIEKEVPTKVATIDEETLNRILSKSDSTLRKEKKFRVEEVEEVRLNTVEYYGKKPKQYVIELNDKDTGIESVEPKEVDNKVYQVELTNYDVEKKRKFSFGRFLLKLFLIILLIALIILLIATIYVWVTPTAPTSGVFQKIEDFLNGIFKANSLQWLRDTFHKLIGTK
ncbi:hypothetical protein [Haploplasma axanthum]|uniref:Uncharacterized protein n=1 Tax=Haploplasma axanthum TaxID=29552 RepID=A0A449BE28_HAPAX|nr:hypothetical protein [Haploplasma axanthum]VEU80685.1 Uncharacterised protein [Haploplasma axanthum]